MTTVQTIEKIEKDIDRLHYEIDTLYRSKQNYQTRRTLCILNNKLARLHDELDNAIRIDKAVNYGL